MRRRIGLIVLLSLAACSPRSETARPSGSPSATTSSPSPTLTVSPSAKPKDALEAGLRAFMDVRMRRDAKGAERYLSANAKQLYDRHEGGLQLVSPTSNPHYTRYELVRRDDVDANSSEFVVRIHEGYTGSASDTSFVETIGVGPGVNAAGEQMPAVVRFARRGSA